MKQLVGSIPDVTIWSHIKRRTKFFRVLLARGAVNSVGRHQQIAILAWEIDVINFSSEKEFDTQLFAASLQNLEKLKPPNSGKAVAMDRNLVVAMDHIDIVPGREISCDCRV